MRVDQLPRDENGVVIGAWRLRHLQPDFTDSLGGIDFRNGASTEPQTGRQLERVLANLGDVLEAEPWATLETQGGEQTAETGADTPAAVRAPQPGPARDQAPTAQAPTAAPAGELATPTTAAELLALAEPDLRTIAGELGATDRRWGVQRMRRFIADELGIEIGDD